MPSDIPLGVFLHVLGGIGAASFYIPFMRVRNWAWESYWLVGGLFIWIVCPWIAALATVPDLPGLLQAAPRESVARAVVLGLGWGVGNLTFGLSLRYLGMSLGFAMSLGFCTFFGAILPPLVSGTLPALIASRSGQMTLVGVAVCLAGIALCGWAGMSKERELPDTVKKESVREYNFVLGLSVALMAGIASACINFAITNDEPIALLAIDRGAKQLWKNGATMAMFLTAGGMTNIAWCLLLNVRNRTLRDYASAHGAPLSANYVLCVLAGLIAYSEFLFYGMAESQMGKYSFTNLPIHLAFIIVFSNVWGFLFNEWKGTGFRTRALIASGLVVLVTSTLFMGYGNDLSTQEAPTPSDAMASPIESLP
jgi:L-rhamnose-H+ transport protein